MNLIEQAIYEVELERLRETYKGFNERYKHIDPKMFSDETFQILAHKEAERLSKTSVGKYMINYANQFQS